MTEQQRMVRAMFEAAGAILDGHFVLSGPGNPHTSVYIDKRPLFLWPRPFLARPCMLLTEHFRGDKVQVVVGPERGGAFIAERVAECLGDDVMAMRAEKGAAGFALSQYFQSWLRGKRVLVVDDTLTSGKSIKETMQSVELAHGVVVGIGVFWARRKIDRADFGNKEVFALVEEELPEWQATECPLCEATIPINVDVGRGSVFKVGN